MASLKHVRDAVEIARALHPAGALLLAGAAQLLRLLRRRYVRAYDDYADVQAVLYASRGAPGARTTRVTHVRGVRCVVPCGPGFQ